jgi:hypothetical protein
MSVDITILQSRIEVVPQTVDTEAALANDADTLQGQTPSTIGLDVLTATDAADVREIIGIEPADYITLDTAAGEPSYAQSRVYWDATDQCWSIQTTTSNTLQVGQEHWIRVVNKTGSTIADGTAVSFTGANGNRPTVAPVRADSWDATKTIGVATASIANNAEGFVCTMGLVRGYNTSGFTAGAALYLSAATAGLLTSTAPTAPNRPIRVAYALNSTNNGAILVDVHSAAHNTDFVVSGSVVVGADPGGSQLLRVGGAIRLSGAVASTSANVVSIANQAVFDWLNGARLNSYGADASTYGTISFIQRKSDGTARIASVIDANGSAIIGTDPGGSELLRVGGSVSATDINPSGSVNVDGGQYVYLRGDASTDGSVRFSSQSAGTMLIEKRASGSWVSIGSFA